MSATRIQTVELPPNVRHYSTTATAESWEAWHALTEDDGWVQKQWQVEPDKLVYPIGIHVQKEATVCEHRIVVFPPSMPGRECPDCHGEAKHNPSPRRDPQAEVDCDTCQGSGEAL